MNVWVCYSKHGRLLGCKCDHCKSNINVFPPFVCDTLCALQRLFGMGDVALIFVLLSSERCKFCLGILDWEEKCESV